MSNVIGAGSLTPPQSRYDPEPVVVPGGWAFGGGSRAGAMAYAELAALRREPAASMSTCGLPKGGWRVSDRVDLVVAVSWSDGGRPSSRDLSDRWRARECDPFFVIPILRTTLVRARHCGVAAVAFAAVHIRGVGPGRFVSNGLATLKVTALLIFIAVGFSIGAGSSANLQQTSGTVTASSWVLALIPVMFTYSGWNAAAYMAEEIRDPGRNVPLALGVGTIGVIAIYLLLNTLYLYVMPVGELAAVRGSVLDVVAEKLLGVQAGNIMGVVSLISLAAGINAWTFAGPRVYYAMARDKMFFQAAARVHPRFKTPVASIVAQALWATVLILTGSLDKLTTYRIALAVSGIAVPRCSCCVRATGGSRPFKAWVIQSAPHLASRRWYLVILCGTIFARPS